MITSADADEISRRFYLLTHPERLRIISMLQEKPETIQSLATGVGLTYQVTAAHLRKMYIAGILSKHFRLSEATYSLESNVLKNSVALFAGALGYKLK